MRDEWVIFANPSDHSSIPTTRRRLSALDEARICLAAGTRTLRDLAAEYQVSPQTIANIIRRDKRVE